MRVGSSPRVAVIGMGGTIAMAAHEGTGAVPALTPAQLVATVPGLAFTGITVETHHLRQRPSSSFTFDDVAALRQEINAQLADGVDGVVVTQGTDTIEETAYLLDVTYGGQAPVVVTGAMRNPSLAGADGPANLLAAVQVAADAAARDQGVLVVFADEIHAARWVRKAHTSSPGAFRSLNGGPLGYVVEGQAKLLQRLTHRTVVPPGPGDPLVGLWTATLGDDGRLLASGAARDWDGLVLAAFGAGHLAEHLVPPAAELAARIPVVLASRTGEGPVLEQTYGFPGSEQDLLERGLLRAGFLHPLKARLLLYALLRVTTDREVIAAALAVAGGYADADRWPFRAPSSM